MLGLGIHCLSSHTYSLTRGGIQTLTLTDKYYIYILPKWIITLHVPITQYGYITLTSTRKEKKGKKKEI